MCECVHVRVHVCADVCECTHMCVRGLYMSVCISMCEYV